MYDEEYNLLYVELHVDDRPRGSCRGDEDVETKRVAMRGRKRAKGVFCSSGSNACRRVGQPHYRA